MRERVDILTPPPPRYRRLTASGVAVFPDLDDFDGIGPARLAERLTDGEDDEIAVLHDAALEQLVLGQLERLLAVARALEAHRVDAAEERHAPPRLDHRAHGIDRHRGLHPRHEQHGLAALRERRHRLDV